MKSLKQKYEEEISPELIKEFKIKNKMAAPKIEKVVINTGIGDIMSDKGKIEKAKEELAAITGQMPSVRQAKVSVASFGIRAGNPVGLAITLRGEKMYSFLNKLFSIVLPRLRDFRGLPIDSFDKFGNYTIGIREHTVFPEVDLGNTTPRGMQVTIVTNTDSNERAFELLKKLGLPFKKEEGE